MVSFSFLFNQVFKNKRQDNQDSAHGHKNIAFPEKLSAQHNIITVPADGKAGGNCFLAGGAAQGFIFRYVRMPVDVLF